MGYVKSMRILKFVLDNDMTSIYTHIDFSCWLVSIHLELITIMIKKEILLILTYIILASANRHAINLEESPASAMRITQTANAVMRR